MPFIPANKINIYYELHGNGPHLLFISGAGSDLRYSKQSRSPLNKHFEVLSYDKRGSGQTESPDIYYSMKDYADDANALLEASGWKSCLVMGASFGGMIAQELAIRYPQRVKRLVLACASSGGAGGNSYPVHELKDKTIEQIAHKFVQTTDIRCDSTWQQDNPLKYNVRFEKWKKTFENVMANQKMIEGFWKQFEARKHHNTYERLPSLKMPVYICGGLYDGMAPASNLRAILRQIPHAKLEFFEGGHLFFREDPQAMKSIISFLKY